jgi:hypothetical protein
MGVLDDAIREHLELKRLRGADPGLVAREEREAFGSVRSNEPAGTDHDIDPSVNLAVASAPPTDDAAVQTGDAQGFSNVGQETAELDMRTVLDAASGHGVAGAEPTAGDPVGDEPSTKAPAEQNAADDSVEWEMPSDGGSVGDPQGGGAADQPDGPVEDVLEETPDFLRDTPEQEQLWFEQRPPRDFDFDR